MQKTYESVCRIFIVEDDPLMKRLIRHVMELNPDHEVYLFDSGKDCLNNLHLNPHIISLDYRLPDLVVICIDTVGSKKQENRGVALLSS